MKITQLLLLLVCAAGVWSGAAPRPASLSLWPRHDVWEDVVGGAVEAPDAIVEKGEALYIDIIEDYYVEMDKKDYKEEEPGKERLDDEEECNGTVQIGDDDPIWKDVDVEKGEALYIDIIEDYYVEMEENYYEEDEPGMEILDDEEEYDGTVQIGGDDPIWKDVDVENGEALYIDIIEDYYVEIEQNDDETEEQDNERLDDRGEYDVKALNSTAKEKKREKNKKEKKLLKNSVMKILEKVEAEKNEKKKAEEKIKKPKDDEKLSLYLLKLLEQERKKEKKLKKTIKEVNKAKKKEEEKDKKEKKESEKKESEKKDCEKKEKSDKKEKDNKEEGKEKSTKEKDKSDGKQVGKGDDDFYIQLSEMFEKEDRENEENAWNEYQ